MSSAEDGQRLYILDKVFRRGQGKESPPNSLHLAELGISSSLFTLSDSSSATACSIFKEQIMATKRYIFALLVLLAIFALSGSIMLYSLSWRANLEQGVVVFDKGTDSRGRPRSRLIQSVEELERQGPLSSSLFEQALSASIRASCDPAGDAILKVFMYDLHPEFHFGMLSTNAGGTKGSVWPNIATGLPRYPGGLYQQHSPEYWLTADLLSSTTPAIRKSPCTAVRVFDQEAADVFFVPFFSSLSYNKYSNSGQGSTKENERLEHRLVAFLKNQPAWQRSGGRDHVIVMHHPNSLRIARNQLGAAMFVVADFGRLLPEVANVAKDVVAPYKHVIPTFTGDSNSYDSRETLLYFQGAIVRKEGGVIRQQLYEILKDQEDVHFTTGNTKRDGFRSATSGMRSSKFCLHLAGDTPSSNRLFDAIASHCVPVIISDDIELPFEDELDYSDFCVFVESARALEKGFLVDLLRGMSREEWRRKWQRLKQVERHFEYQHPSLPEDAVHMTWKAIARRLPQLRLLTHKRHRYLRST